MSVYSEEKVFAMEPVASLSTSGITSLEGQAFKSYALDIIANASIVSQYKIDAQSIGEIYSHHCVGNNLKKAAITALPSILNNALVVKPWRQGDKDTINHKKQAWLLPQF